MGRGRGEEKATVELGEVERFAVSEVDEFTPRLTARLAAEMKTISLSSLERNDPTDLIDFFRGRRWLLETPRHLDVDLALTWMAEMFLIDEDNVRLQGLANRFLWASGGEARVSKLIVSPDRYAKERKPIHLRATESAKETLCCSAIEGNWQLQHSADDWNDPERFERCRGCISEQEASYQAGNFRFSEDGYLGYLNPDESWQATWAAVEPLAQGIYIADREKATPSLITQLRPRVANACRNELAELSAKRLLTLSEEERFKRLFVTPDGHGWPGDGGLGMEIYRQYGAEPYLTEWPETDKLAALLAYANLEQYPNSTEEEMNANRVRAAITAELWWDAAVMVCRRILDPEQRTRCPGAMEVWRNHYAYVLPTLPD